MKPAGAPLDPAAQAGAGGLAPAVEARPTPRANVRGALAEWLRGGAVLALAPWIILAILVALYGAKQAGVYSLNELNTFTGETLTLILISFGQTLVIVSGGIDLSVGGLLSLVTCLAALHFGDGGAQMWLVMAALIAGSTAAGAANGLLIGVTRMQPFIVTLATFSIFAGAALWVLPTNGGTVPANWVAFGNGSWLGVGTAVWLLILLVAFWLFFKRTRLWFEIRSVGSSQEAAFLSGVPVLRTIVSTYALSGLFAALAGLYYITQSVSGSPTVGTDYILTSIIAVVLGGTALTGGRGGFGGTIAGAYIPTLIGSVIFIYGIDSNWQPLLEGLLLILAVLLNVLVAHMVRRGECDMSAAQGAPAGPLPDASVRVPRRIWAAANGPNRSIVLAYVIAVAMFLITTAFTPGFASPTHIKELLIEASFIGIVGLGQTFVIIGGGVDLSIPFVLCASGIILTILTGGQNGPLIWVIPVLLLLAAIVGLLNGIGIAMLGISPIIMTLGMNVIVEGALLVYMGGRQAAKAPPLIVHWTFDTLGPIPINTLIWLALTVIATAALSWTTFGRRLYALGTSRIVAAFSGVNVVPIIIATYVTSAVSAAIAGILYTGFVAQPYLGMGDPYLFASVAAVAVGGAPLIGGSGHYIGTVAGALVLTVLADLLPILNLDPGALQIIYGVTILVTVALATVRFRGVAV